MVENTQIIKHTHKKSRSNIFLQSQDKNSNSELRHYCMRLETVLLQTRKKESEIQSDFDFLVKQY
jgi:hypothetical protein